ncbi:phospholipase A2 inhibitor and Ly6/PLAUR domain-containing protein-like [Lithobates pipiens]
MNYILAFLIFSGVIATGNALKCNTCEVEVRGSIPNNCEGKLVECDDDTFTCATQIEQNNVDGDLVTTVRKRCFPLKDKDYCERRFELNARERFYLTVFTKCCDLIDGCNSGPIEMPAGDTTPNGLTCPLCFKEDSVACTPTDIKCVGDQLQCIDFRGPAARPGEKEKDYAIQGCLTQYACYLNFDGLPATRVISKEYTCTPHLIPSS